ncbi:uncharacterized protein LOC143445111 [Clavelina lepadiformis]|uniref:uncharacterized protein LOC143445111 n=1 Tax=Clavelina lepadiformis TaxID=159417 RepID=UPI0040427B38
MDQYTVTGSEIMTMLEAHMELATAEHVSILLLCICGMVLNIGMLVIFFTKKQVRGSIYTTYMIQIAITDLLVCLVWLIISSVYLDDLPNKAEIPDPTGSQIVESVEDVEKNLLLHRFTLAVYYFHYYNNIFLLATMSVERCVAVWKSLRCQRYQFNRKFIYGVSVAMWLIAFSCALPSFINPDLITQHEQTHLLLDQSMPEDTFKMLKCAEPLEHAIYHNQTYVSDYNKVSVKDCINMIMDYSYSYYASLGQYPTNVDSYEDGIDYEPEEEEQVDGIVYYLSADDENQTTPAVKRETYGELFKIVLELITAKTKDNDLNGVCDPGLSRAAKIYYLVVNLSIGFFLPFLAIVISYLAIAYMIGKRARQRLESDNTDDTIEEAPIGRRMSDFIRHFTPGKSTRFKAANEQYSRDSPNLPPRLRKAKSRHRTMEGCSCDVIHDNNNSGENGIEAKKKFPTTLITVQQASPEHRGQGSPGPHSLRAGARERRPRLSSFSTVEMRRTSGGSASSAESFPTEQTSLQTSPGVRLSAPNFLSPDKTLIQRACSADSGTSGHYYNLQPNTRRWSSEVFRSSTIVTDDGRYHQRGSKDVESCFSNHEDKPSSPASVENKANESTQELLHSSHARLYKSKRQYSRQYSGQSNCRNRAYSAASRASGGGGTLRKTSLHKNAERNMRVSRTVVAYVVAFSICWLPQRIAKLIYVTEGLMGMPGYHCHLVMNVTRVISFFSVLLNPIVYAVTQRAVRHFVRHTVCRLCKCLCPSNIRQKLMTSPRTNGVQHQNGLNGNENANFSNIVINNVTSDGQSRRERHERNREMRSRLVHKLGRRNMTRSFTGSGLSNHADKHSDGTIDEEHDEDKALNLKGQSLSNSTSKSHSSSNSFKPATGGWEDWKELIDMAAVKTQQTQPLVGTVGESVI